MDDCTLEKLAVKPGKLTPSFQKSHLEYDVTVPSNVEKIHIDPLTSDSGASYCIFVSELNTFVLNTLVAKRVMLTLKWQVLLKLLLDATRTAEFTLRVSCYLIQIIRQLGLHKYDSQHIKRNAMFSLSLSVIFSMLSPCVY